MLFFFCAGGSVVSVRCSKTYFRKTALFSVFGIPLWYISNSARTVIQVSFILSGPMNVRLCEGGVVG